ncbi:hypothetical protein N865_18995 [Intrasporangium oryzae NRRL B-24470]|uniref:DUF306 domain-containing protein n=1 Tax=Intrasporangium oryzae NRRL B-24470 TaxID=1386089 RepID=W9GHE1_9MICO|nr:META domain-containing protein [Intrasporangium oryzae]EWT03309.1 hypothetical protein N865_18995 [Intrasporangium oryzae NRRL B-24470]
MGNEIEGTTWLVEEIGGTPTTGRKPELAFGDDGRLSGSTGVNRLIGQYEVEGDVIRFGNAGSTRMAGLPEAMEQESRFLAVITGDVTYSLMGDRLVLGPVPGGAVPAAVLMEQAAVPVGEPVGEGAGERVGEPVEGPAPGPAGGLASGEGEAPGPA